MATNPKKAIIIMLSKTRKIPNKSIKVVPRLWPSTGRPCQGVASDYRWGCRKRSGDLADPKLGNK